MSTEQPSGGAVDPSQAIEIAAAATSAPAIPPGARIPGAPDLHAPVPRDPVEGLDLAGYARLAGAMAAKRPRAEVLAAARLDEMRWVGIEQTFLLRLAAAALRREMDLIEEHERAFAEGRAG